MSKNISDESATKAALTYLTIVILLLISGTVIIYPISPIIATLMVIVAAFSAFILTVGLVTYGRMHGSKKE